jgi:hypothetical protein
MAAGSLLCVVLPKFRRLSVFLSLRRLEDGGSKIIVNVDNIDSIYKKP